MPQLLGTHYTDNAIFIFKIKTLKKQLFPNYKTEIVCKLFQEYESQNSMRTEAYKCWDIAFEKTKRSQFRCVCDQM